MALIKRDSRSRAAIEWYDSEAEAAERGDAARQEPGVNAANLGMVRVGRAPALDKVENGVTLYAVVTP